jgi:DNA-binding CsgD family transcriptional regulator
VSSFGQMIGNVSSKYHDRIKTNCASLFSCYGLNDFFYYKVSSSGQLSLFNYDLAWAEYYGDQKFYLLDPYFRHPKNYQRGVVLLHNSEEESLRQIFTAGKEKNNRGCSLMLLSKTDTSVEAFGFCPISTKDEQISLLLSEIHILKQFAKHFQENCPKIFSNLDENGIDMRSFLGPRFDESSVHMDAPTDRGLLLRELAPVMKKTLSLMEKRIIGLVLEGYSASQIAKRLFRSKRTIEHSLEKIKGKLGCSSKAELVQQARELEKMGILYHLDKFSS